MGFNLPQYTGWVDVPFYAGMEMECWLNPVKDDWEPPENPEPWDNEYWYAYGRLFKRLRVPAGMTGDGEEQVIELGSAKAVYELTDTPGFDQGILPRVMAAWGEQREALLEAAQKN